MKLVSITFLIIIWVFVIPILAFSAGISKGKLIMWENITQCSIHYKYKQEFDNDIFSYVKCILKEDSK